MRKAEKLGIPPRKHFAAVFTFRLNNMFLRICIGYLCTAAVEPPRRGPKWAPIIALNNHRLPAAKNGFKRDLQIRGQTFKIAEMLISRPVGSALCVHTAHGFWLYLSAPTDVPTGWLLI